MFASFFTILNILNDKFVCDDEQCRKGYGLGGMYPV